jgi:hypothetical protein
MTQMGQITAAHLAPLDPFQLWPKALPQVQRRGIGRQALQVEAWPRAIRAKLPDGMTAVNRRSIPDDHHPAGHLAPQVLEKPNHSVSVDHAVLAADVPLAFLPVAACQVHA